MSQEPPGPRPNRRWPRRLALALVAVLLVVGPWPVDDSGFEGSAYQSSTLDRLERVPASLQAGPVRVGTAEVDLTPNAPRPLAGFIGQVRTPYVGVDSPCLARALTIESAAGPLTILASDLLLIDARLARATCEAAGVDPGSVYFTASHTHGGPGGWGSHPLEMLAAGAYDPAFFADLTARLAKVVRASRLRLEPAEVAFVQVQARGRQSNRVEKGGTTHDALSALAFRSPGGGPGLIALVTVFGAHATVSHPVPPRLGGDYPAALAAELVRRTGARTVLFAAGAVGDASPARPKADSPLASAEALGQALADDLMAVLPSARFEREVPVGSIRLDVDLSTVRLPMVGSRIRFSPLATWWISDRQTHLHAVRIGPTTLVGFPGDYSGHLADRLVASTRPGEPSVVATSFDGDYRGYLVSARVFRDIPCYETRWMSFYGPWAGEYLNDLATRMVNRLSDHPADSPRAARSNDHASRVALGALLAVALVLVGRRWSEAWAWIVGVGPVTLAIASAALLAFEVDPEAVAWARFGLPDWAWSPGLLIGCFALATSRSRPSRAPLPFALACVLISGSWPVVLMIARAWLKSSLRAETPAARPAS